MINTRPNFFIIGAAKSGTTSLANYLSQHPDIFIPETKEPKFFSLQDNIFPHRGPGDKIVDKRVIKNLEEYERLFASASNARAKGEASVDYLYFYKSAERIKLYNSDSKIIIILRNPADRAFSAYMHMIKDGRETLPFNKALREEKKRKNANWEFFWLYKSLGFYYQQVKYYLECFGSKNVYVIIFEDFIQNTKNIMEEVFTFLNVEYSFCPDLSVKHNISGLPKNKFLHNFLNRNNIFKRYLKYMLPENFRKEIKKKISDNNLKKIKIPINIYKRLLYEYENDIKSLETILGKNLEIWQQ